MNIKKLWTKLVAIGLGMTMALGVGLTASKVASEVNAAEANWVLVTQVSDFVSGQKYLLTYSDKYLKPQAYSANPPAPTFSLATIAESEAWVFTENGTGNWRISDGTNYLTNTTSTTSVRTTTTAPVTYFAIAEYGTSNAFTFTYGTTNRGPSLYATTPDWRAYVTSSNDASRLTVYKYVASTKTLLSIAISGSMTKTSYYTEDSWDPTGLVVTGTYSDSSTADVTSSVSWSYNPTAPNLTSITSVTATASFGGKTNSKIISGIAVSVPAYQSATLAYAGSTTGNMVDGNNATSVGLDASMFNVVSTKRVVEPLHIGLNKAGQIRLYGSTDGAGNILTVSLLDSSYYISAFTVNYGSTVGSLLIKSGEDTIFTGTPVSSGTQVYTWLNDSSFSLQNTNTSTAQIYIMSIEITYVTFAQGATLFANEVNSGEGLNAQGKCSEVLTSLTAKYNSLPPSAQAIFDSSSDTLFVNARARMAYLASWVAANTPQGLPAPVQEFTNSSIIIIVAFLGLGTAIAYFFLKRKKA